MRYGEKPFRTLQILEENKFFTITISNPPVNALSKEVRHELRRALECASGKSWVEAIFIRGEHNFFSAGADIHALKEISEKKEAGAGRSFSRCGQELVRYIQKYKKIYGKPIIAHINGYALGGGLELALACNTIFAEERSILGFPEVTLGLIPAWGGTIHLFSRCKNPPDAQKMITEGTLIPAKEALRMGIIDSINVFGNDSMLPMPDLHTPAPLANFFLKKIYFGKKFNESIAYDFAFDRESMAFDFLASQNDAREGINAFLEKREPQFKHLEMDIKK